MPTFLIDEDLPRSTAPALRQAGYTVTDIRDVGLRGQSDQQIFDYAQEHAAVLVTADKDFANLLRFPAGTHAGIVVLRIPDVLPSTILNRELVSALTVVGVEDLTGALVIVELGRIRIRRV